MSAEARHRMANTLHDEPVLHTLGEYELGLAAEWTPTSLTVTRTWTRSAH